MERSRAAVSLLSVGSTSHSLPPSCLNPMVAFLNLSKEDFTMSSHTQVPCTPTQPNNALIDLIGLQDDFNHSKAEAQALIMAVAWEDAYSSMPKEDVECLLALALKSIDNCNASFQQLAMQQTVNKMPSN